MDDMIEMKPPSVLNGERAVTDHRDTLGMHAENERVQLREALKQSCDYGLMLWHELDRMRAYLLESAPEARDTSSGVRRIAATPLGPDDEAGWQRWQAIYEKVSETLCGPSGDSGFAAREAALQVRDRRSMDPPATPAPPMLEPVPEPQEVREEQVTAASASPLPAPPGRARDDKSSFTPFLAGTALGLMLRTLLRRRPRS